jgi:phage gp45-like
LRRWAQYEGQVDAPLHEQDALLAALQRLRGNGVSVQVDSNDSTSKESGP